MPKEKKRADNVGSARSRKAGQQAQDEFTQQMQSLVKNLENKMQLTIEPNADTFNNILNKKDKKKLN